MAVAAVALKPPVIHEPFTVLPCPMHPQTTIALEGCEEHALLKSDAAIDAAAKTVFGLLPASGRRSFVTSEATWLRYRRSSCDAQSSPYAGGTIQPVEYAACELQRDATHLADLRAAAKALRIH